jgi:hypothetical protein
MLASGDRGHAEEDPGLREVTGENDSLKIKVRCFSKRHSLYLTNTYIINNRI